MKKLTTIFIFALIMLCLTGCGEKKKMERLQNKADNLQIKVDELEAENQELSDKIAELEAQNIKLIDTNDSLEDDLADAKETIDDLKNNTSSSSSDNSEIQKLKDEIAKKDAALAASKQNSAPIVLLADSTQASNYIAITFYADPDGKRFSSKGKWYNNPRCYDADEIKGDVVIISEVIKSDSLNSGFKFYTCMSTNGLVFAREKPYLKETK